MTEKFSTSVTINSEPSKVWATLIDLKLMSEWMGDPEMGIEVQTDWKLNSPIVIRGFHHVKFENKGKVILYEKEKRVYYTHLSSLSQLEDKLENYSTIEFLLKPDDTYTQLTINIKNFPTETIRKHLEFYWRNAISYIKKVTENRTTNS